MKLGRDFYLRDGITVARELIGKILVHETPMGRRSGRIVETEAYLGKKDAAAHSYKGDPCGRTRIQYGQGGYAYIYMIYGVHYCMNVVANLPGEPEAVLIRALEPLEGFAAGRRPDPKLCAGPGKLCAALEIGREQYGMDLCGDILYLEEEPSWQGEVGVSKRINVDYAGEAADYPYRFFLKGSPCLSLRESSVRFRKYCLTTE